MKAQQLISIALFTMATVFTIYAWMERLNGTNPKLNEAFANPTTITEEDLRRIQNSTAAANAPTDDEAIQAHQTLLRYIRNDFSKGVKFVMDFGKRFYGDALPIRDDLDVQRLMDNYSNPLQVV